jgi:predicted metal-binding protein
VSFRRSLCVALAFMNLPRRDCDHCDVHDCMGLAMRRLRELNEHALRVSRQKITTRSENHKNDAA